MRRNEGINRQHVQRRWAVYKDVVVPRFVSQRRAQTVVVVSLLPAEFSLRTGQSILCRQEIKSFAHNDHGVAQRASIQQQLVTRARQIVSVHAATYCGVGLRVQVDQ